MTRACIAVLLFRDEYESYIKHYPYVHILVTLPTHSNNQHRLAEARHRAELKRNRDYHYFMQQAVQDPRVRKHDLATFLSRPVTRLPRLSLVLEHLHKLTDSDHPDQETLPLILSILSEFIKSTQPGIAAADSKAKFWDLSESLQYMKGEIIVSQKSRCVLLAE
jgi:RHO1 GDP-GTP exchange protein 1/2